MGGGARKGQIITEEEQKVWKNDNANEFQLKREFSPSIRVRLKLFVRSSFGSDERGTTLPPRRPLPVRFDLLASHCYFYPVLCTGVQLWNGENEAGA